MTTSGPRASDDWNRHWSAYAESAAQNPAQAYRRALIADALGLSAVSGPVRLLEVGCGQGDLSRELTVLYPSAELLGIDLSQTGVAIARGKVPNGVFFQQDLLRPLTLPEGYLGWATHAVCSEVLEHLDDPVAALMNVRRLLAPGGRLVLTVPAGPMSAFDRHIGHRRHFSAETLGAVLAQAGFEASTVAGAGFPFFNLYRLSVIARGKRLVHDADGERPLPLTARAAMRLFGVLFRFNDARGSLGWQLVATARAPGSGDAAC
jgi:SAM-dependent methyltransferase